MDNLSQMYKASPAICNHAVLAVTQHTWMHPTLTPARQVNTQSTLHVLPSLILLRLGHVTLLRGECQPSKILGVISWIVTFANKIRLIFIELWFLYSAPIAV